MTVKFLPVFGIALAGFLFSAAAGSAGAVEVDIKFSQHLAKVMPRVNAIERQREEVFRRHRQTPRTSIVHDRRFATVRWPAVQWASEVLIPDFDDFSVEALTRGLVTASLERAGVSGVGWSRSNCAACKWQIIHWPEFGGGAATQSAASRRTTRPAL